MEKEKGNFKIWWDEENKIIRSKLAGDQTPESAEAYVSQMRELIKKLREKGYQKVDSINDATEAALTYDPPTRKAFTNWLKEAKENGYTNKTAIFGLNSASRVVVNFLVAFSGEKGVKFFPDDKSSLEWIKEK